MLTKIARQTLKNKWRDLLVLFAGFVISTAIFYMFSTVANNEAFLKTNISLSVISIVFIVGEVLLGLIVFVYLNFANRFLLQLRQREYGLLMMFGANKRSISQLLFLETFGLGLIALIVGSLLGAVLTAGSSYILQAMLDIKITHWQIFNVKGFLITAIFFIAVYTINGLFNQIYIRFISINKLLRAETVAEKTPKRGLIQVVIGILGILILCASFFILKNKPIDFGIWGRLLGGLVTNVLGTYLTIRSGLSLIIMGLQKSDVLSKGLRRFTLGQLSFRLSAFERILTIVTLLFALSLGALTVGRGYQLSVPILANQSDAFTIDIRNMNNHEKGLVAQLDDKTYAASYTTKKTNGQLWWQASDFDKKPMPFLKLKQMTEMQATAPKVYYADSKLLAQDSPLGRSAKAQLLFLNDDYSLSRSRAVPDGEFNAARGPITTLNIVTVKDMYSEHNKRILNAIVNSQQERFTDLKINGLHGTFGYYVMSRAMFGGLEFMGFFLSIAFLVMLASTLMFKILSNVNADQRRYQILAMLGATRQQRLKANAIEIGVLFAVPLIIGIVDVVAGLQLFKDIMVNAYIGLPTALLTIGAFYLIYYGVTVIIYQRMLKKGNK